MINEAIWWVGVTTIATGTIAVLALLVVVTIDKVLKLTGFSRALLQAYARLMTDKMHERQMKEKANV